METYYEVLLRDSCRQLDELVQSSLVRLENPNHIDETVINESPSTLDTWDYCFCIAIGLTAPFISTNEELQSYLEGIHSCASEANGEYDFLQKCLGTLLHHKRDPIDMPGKKFIKRDGENAWVLFHRLLWGHDVLSLKEDNPFFLMVRKQGLSGIIQAVQHLLADTTSKQGLPCPGSSYFDFCDENGSLSNYLIKVSQTLSQDVTGSKRYAEKIYAHMFTIRGTDIVGSCSVGALSKGYFLIRSINDTIRIEQFLLISYSICFWAQVLIGLGGVLGTPYVNFPAGYGMIKSFACLYMSSGGKTKELIDNSIKANIYTDDIENISRNDEELLPQYNTADEYLEELKKSEENISCLASAWKKRSQDET